MADFGAMLHGAIGAVVLILLIIPTVLLATSQVKHKSSIRFCVLASLVLSIAAIAVGDLTYTVYRNKKDSTSARWVIKRGTVTYSIVTPEAFELLGIDPPSYEQRGRTLSRVSRFVVWDAGGSGARRQRGPLLPRGQSDRDPHPFGIRDRMHGGGSSPA